MGTPLFLQQYTLCQLEVLKEIEQPSSSFPHALKPKNALQDTILPKSLSVCTVSTVKMSFRTSALAPATAAARAWVVTGPPLNIVHELLLTQFEVAGSISATARGPR